MDEEGWSSCDATDLCGSWLLYSLPDDVLSIISTSLPRDLCNLSLCCHSLRSLTFSSKLWLVQCSITDLLHPRDLLKWRPSLSTYRVLCRFLLSARPFLDIWVNPYPKYGSLVFVTRGFLSVIACRVTPKPSSSCIDPSPLLWDPVFEITSRPNGSMQFFLHGHEGESNFLHPGLVNWIDPNCNILLVSASAPFYALQRPRLGGRAIAIGAGRGSGASQVTESLNGCFPLFFHQSIDEEAGDGDLGLSEECRSYLINMYNNLHGVVVNWQLLPGKPDSEENSRSPEQFCLKLQ